MTTIDFMIERVTGEKIPRFCVHDLAHARTLVLSHVLRFKPWLDFAREFEEGFGVRWTYADREILLSDPLVMRHLRFVLYSVMCHHGHASVRNLRNEARKAGLQAEDEPLLRLCRERLLSHFDKFLAEGFYPLTLSQFDTELARVWQCNARFVAGYAWVHLRFLTHWNMTMDHIQQDLSGKAIAIVTEMYPTFRNPGHLHTVYRSVVQQLGLKMIKRARTQKRSIMDCDNNKSSVSLDAQLADGNLDLHSLVGDQSHETLELRAETANLVTRLAELESGSLLVRLLCGEYTDDFTLWMRNTQHISNLDAYASNWPLQFRQRCLAYCGIDFYEFQSKVGNDGLICSG